jgi:hypothetical protein
VIILGYLDTLSPQQRAWNKLPVEQQQATPIYDFTKTPIQNKV